MKLMTRKVLVFLSLLFYISAAGAASLHGLSINGLPMNGLPIDGMSEPSSSSTNLGMDGKNSMMDQAGDENCHTSGMKQSISAKSSLSCELFCSVLAHAITIDYLVSTRQAACEAKPPSILESYISLHNQIDPRPPKVLS